MGRALVWCCVLLCGAALTWLLLGDDWNDVDGGVEHPYAEDTGTDEEAAGPGLKTRDHVPVAEAPVVATGDASIYGIVMDEDGKPLSGLRIAAQPRGKTTTPIAERNRRAAMELFLPPRRPGEAVAWGTSKPDGSFEIAGLEENERYRIIAEVDAPRFCTSMDWTAMIGKRWTARLIVGKGSALRGRVVDAEGKGLEAWVSVRRQGNIGNKTYIQGRWNPLPFVTDKKGSFTLDAVPNGTLLFKVSVLGRGSRTNLPIDTPTDKVVELAFEDPSGATVEGRVTDTAGRGIADAKVSVRSAPERAGGFVSTTMRATATDASGNFSINRLTPGVIQSVVVWAEGYVPPGAMGGGMPLTEDKPTRLDIILARGATITGRALDPTGQPIPDATVQAARVGTGYGGGWNQQLATATTDAEGKFTLVDVALGPGELKGKAEGYYQPPKEGQSSPYPWMPPPTGVAYDAKEEGQSLEKDIELARGRTITGTVKDESDNPAAGVRVTVSIVSGGYYWGFQGHNTPVLTGDDGTFKYEGLAPDKSYNVIAQSATHMADAVKVTIPKDGDPKPIEIKLQRGGSVQGRVTEADGSPATGASVTVNSGAVAAVTDAKGMFEITGVKAGKWTVQVGNVNPLPPSAKTVVTVEWGETVDGIELTMPVTLTIQGMVSDPDGKPLPGIAVRARGLKMSGNRLRARGRSYYATSDTKGHFELKALTEGDYTVWAGSAKESPIRAGDEDVQLTYEEPERVTVEGRVTDPDGKAVVRGQVRVWYGPRGKRKSQASGNITGGYFRVRIVTNENEVDVEVTQASDATNRPVNFLPDRETDLSLGAPLEVRLNRGLEVSGSITDAAGKGLAGMQIRLTAKGKRNYGWYGYNSKNQARSDDDGHWTVKGLKDGEYTLAVTPSGAWITPEKQDVSTGEKDVVIKLIKGLAITGKVFDPDGEPLAGANVWAQETPASKASRGKKAGGHDWMASMRLRAQTGADGSYEIKGLPERSLFHVNGGGNGAKQPFISDVVKDVAAGTKDVNLNLGFGLLIEGEVYGPDGEPIRNGWISAQPVDPKAGLRAANTNLQSGKHTFKLGPLMPGRYRITVQVHGNTYGNPEPQETDAGAKGLRFVCTHPRVITGRIDGDDVQGFIVYFRGTNGSTVSSGVSKDGSFTMRNVKSSTGTLFANKAGDDRYGYLTNVEASRGPYDIPLKEGEAITGVVDNLPMGKKIPQVYAYGHGIWIRAKVDMDGGFIITGLRPGKYNVQGWMNGGQIPQKPNVEAGTAGLVLEFRSNK